VLAHLEIRRQGLGLAVHPGGLQLGESLGLDGVLDNDEAVIEEKLRFGLLATPLFTLTVIWIARYKRANRG
jgi:hypothetical protein